MKLNCGSGSSYMDGWVNLDIGNIDVYGKKIKVDVVHNLNEFPYPFPNDYFEEVWMNQVLEHLDEPIKVVRELERICKDEAKITIQVPHFSHFKAYLDPTHKHYFSLFSIDLIKGNCELVKRGYDISDNPIMKVIGKVFTLFPLFYERFLYAHFPVMGNIWILKVKK